MQLAVIYGDPYGSGEYVVQEKMPAGYAFPAHNHPGTENFTIINRSISKPTSGGIFQGFLLEEGADLARKLLQRKQ
jgi:anti-sigma factor ChrR (cupin superfamily)